MHRALIILAASLAALAGCLGVAHDGNENSPYYPIPVGSRLTLNKELTIPAEQVGVFLQDGRALSSAEVSHFGPYCKIELYTLRNVARKIAPDEFTITRVGQERTKTGAGGPMPYGNLYASLVADIADRDGKAVETFATRMDLRSAKQPDVFRLICSQWGHPGMEHHVTIAEIRSALGELFTLRLSKKDG